MTDKQPKALWLADMLEKGFRVDGPDSEAAAELRRLHALCARAMVEPDMAERDVQIADMQVYQAIADGYTRDTQPVSAAEVPMPEPDTHCYDDDVGRDVWSHSPEQMRTYGEQCRAAGYAAGVAAGGKDAERYRFLRQDFSPMGLDIDCNHAWAYRRNATLKGPNLDAAIDAALLGEVK